MQHLKPNTTLQGGKYRIERVLGQGGFGITYLAEQVLLSRKVAIKEFFMKELCGRGYDTRSVEIPSTGSRKLVEQYRNKFIKEAKNLARLNHPHIIPVIDVFEENSTVYYVMHYLAGGSLQDYVKMHSVLSEQEAMKYVKQIASALKYMHNEEHICHFDVKPANILLDDRGNAVLIDFGISKHYDAAGQETTTTPIGMSDGYAPIEQYSNMAGFSPTSDVYALGATLYFLLHGKRPVKATARVGGAVLLVRKQLSQGVKDIINTSMKLSRRERAQSMDVFLHNIKVSNKKQYNPVLENEEATIVGESERSSVDGLRDKLRKKYSGESYKSLIQDHYKLLDLADKGNTDAQYEVGEWFRKSNSLLACEESVRWYKVAADGNCRAMFKLGVSYEYGCGVIKDIDIARFWYQKAAEQGYEPAKQCLLRIDPVQNGEKEAVNKSKINWDDVVVLFIFFIIVSLIGGCLGWGVFALLRDYVTIPITDEMQINFVIGGAITLNLLLWLWNGLTDS